MKTTLKLALLASSALFATPVLAQTQPMPPWHYTLGIANHVGDGAISSTAARIETKPATYRGSGMHSLRAKAVNSSRTELATKTVQTGEVSDSRTSGWAMKCYLTSVDVKSSSIDVQRHVRGAGARASNGCGDECSLDPS